MTRTLVRRSTAHVPVADRKRERDRHVAQYRRDLRKRRRALAVAWLDMLRRERDFTLPGARRSKGAGTKLADLRTKLEDKRVEYLAEARSYRRNPRAHIDALFWLSWISLEQPGRRARKPRGWKHENKKPTPWDAITSSVRRARLAVAWLDAGRAWIDRLGGGTAAIQKVAANYAAPTRPRPAKAAKVALEGIPATAWAAALAEWRGWHLGPRKGGRRPAGAVIYEPDRIVTDLLSAGGLKMRRGDSKRDILGVRKKAQIADKTMKTIAGSPRRK